MALCDWLGCKQCLRDGPYRPEQRTPAVGLQVLGARPEAHGANALGRFRGLDEVDGTASRLAGDRVPVGLEEGQEFRDGLRPEMHVDRAQDHGSEEAAGGGTGLEFDAERVPHSEAEQLAGSAAMAVGAVADGDFEEAHVVEQGEALPAGDAGV